MSSEAAYRDLVADRRACRRCAPLDLTNPSTLPYDSDEIGPWTLWQGKLDAELLVVGQDCGDVEFFLKHGGNEVGVANPTNKALQRLLGSARPGGVADNGGPTQTIALQAGSPAIDAGDPEVCANPPVNGLDQRDFVRPGIGHTRCSIGAYEAQACTGDCDGNGVVAINELILGVNIVFELQPVDACPAFVNAEGMVDIAQLMKGVNNALSGCGAS